MMPTCSVVVHGKRSARHDSAIGYFTILIFKQSKKLANMQDKWRKSRHWCARLKGGWNSAVI
jgi:hypothetical protein